MHSPVSGGNFRVACIPPGADSACSGHPLPSLKVGFTARTQGACSQRRCGESPCANLQRVSSEDRRTPVRGQAVEQSAEMRSALEFFATAQSCRERQFQSTVLSLAVWPELAQLVMLRIGRKPRPARTMSTCCRQSSMKKWRKCASLHSVQGSPSLATRKRKIPRASSSSAGRLR